MPLPASAFPLRTSGSKILGADGSVVRLAGVNWGGAYQDNLVPSGLDKQPLVSLIDWIINHGFSTVRFPFATGTFVTSAGNPVTSAVDPARVAANPTLAGLTPAQVYQACVSAMTARGLLVVVNKHLNYPGWCCSDNDVNGFWYNDNWPSSTFTRMWTMVAGWFAHNPRVAFDLHNEPRKAMIGGAVRSPTWGTGSGGSFPADFRQMYQNTIGRIRSAVAAAGSGITHLAICEGLAYAGNLTGWKAAPVTGANIVASAHDYPWFHRHADGSPQSWAEYKAQNDSRWGYLVSQGIVPVWVGECGQDTSMSRQDFNHGWVPNFVRYMQGLGDGAHWCWWTLNATEQKGTEPGTNKVKTEDGQSEGFGLLRGQDWMGTQVDSLTALAPIMPGGAG